LGLKPDRAESLNEIAARMSLSYEHLMKIDRRLIERPDRAGTARRGAAYGSQ